MSDQISLRKNGSVGWRTGVLLLSLLIALMQVQVQSQEDSDGPSVTDLESYEDLPRKDGSESDHWYRVSHGDQWIGWSRMQSHVLESYQGGGNEASNISVYKYSSQVSPQLIQEQLRKKFREEIRNEKEEGQALTRSDLDKLVTNRVTSRMRQFREVVERKSKTSTIFRNQNNTLREARYGVSSDESGSFTLYLEPKQLGSGEFTLLVPGEVPGEIEVSRERPIVNYNLAAHIMAEDSFQKDTYQFYLLEGDQNNPLVRTDVSLTTNEAKELKIGGDSYKVWPARVSLEFPDTITREEKWWVGTDEDGQGILRKISRPASVETGGEQEEGAGTDKVDTITFTYSTREEAREGYGFVFARRGRRNPFKPVWPKPEEESEGGEQSQPEECADYVAEEVLNRAKRIALEEAPNVNEISNKQQRINTQRSLIQEFTGLKNQVFLCGSQKEQEQMEKYEQKLQSEINISTMVISIVREKLKSTKEAFQKRSFDQVASLAEEVMDWKNQMPSSASEEEKTTFKNLVQAVQKFNERATIRRTFREQSPTVLGLISSQNDRERSVEMTIDVFGDRTSADLTVNIPDVKSIAIIQAQDGEGNDEAKRPGEKVEVPGLEKVVLSEVHKDGAVFKYKGESIKVPIFKFEDSVGKKQ